MLGEGVFDLKTDLLLKLVMTMIQIKSIMKPKQYI